MAAEPQKGFFMIDKDKRKDYFKVYCEANKDKRRATAKAWGEANRDKIKANKKAYFKAYVNNLTTPYIKKLLKSIGIHNPTKEMIEQKRLSLKIKHKIKQLNNEKE